VTMNVSKEWRESFDWPRR